MAAFHPLLPEAKRHIPLRVRGDAGEAGSRALAPLLHPVQCRCRSRGSRMKLRKFAFAAAAALTLAAPLAAETHIQPAVQPGGDIPKSFKGSVPPIPKGGDIPKNFAEAPSQIVVGFSKGDDSAAARKLSDTLVQALSRRWRIHEVPNVDTSGAFPLRDCNS